MQLTVQDSWSRRGPRLPTPSVQNVIDGARDELAQWAATCATKTKTLALGSAMGRLQKITRTEKEYGILT